LQPQRNEQDIEVRAKIKQKLENVMAKGYITQGSVSSLTSFFTVPKVKEDIRLVYDASRSGLNKVLWAPSFPLPSVDTLTDMVEPTTWMADLDMGEQFLNFPLDVHLRSSCGIDVRPFLAPGRKQTLWLRWERCMMGLTNSPYVVVKGTHLADESALGDRQDPKNPFRWSHVRLNLPGMESYNPQLPWVSRLRPDGSLAAGVPRYVDDLRPLGDLLDDCWQVAHTIATRYGLLGLQVTSGAFVSSTAAGVGVSCGQEKWDKARGIIHDLNRRLTSSITLQHKDLEQKRGFLVHLQRTYPCITPFLKGIHLTLDSWRPGRNSEGWKEGGDPDPTDILFAPDSALQPPTHVDAVSRLKMDLEALSQLFDPPPPTNSVRASYTHSSRLVRFWRRLW